MQPFDLYHARLDPGTHLIEASAGTGKTYSIAHLVTRFVVEEAIPVEAVLVVTFTTAATAELRQRIQQRLIQVRDGLIARLEGQSPPLEDAALSTWIAELDEPEARLKRLEGELLKFDLMPVQTIHSFSQYALRQQALEAGELLGQTLLKDDSAFNQQIIDDLWRKRAQSLSPRLWRRILARTATPDQLYTLIREWKPPLRFFPQVTLPDHEEIPPCTGGEWQRFYQWMEGLCEQKLFKSSARGWWQNLKTEPDLPRRLNRIRIRPDLIDFLAGEVMKKVGGLANLPDYEQYRRVLENLTDIGRRQAQIEIAWLQTAWRQWQTDYEHRLREQGWLTHDFMIRRLAAVLEEEANPAVIRNLQEHFRLVLIDEFQDTDRHQWRIFSKLFRTDEHWLFLIGDPKQSVYRFRGADLYTYYRAREEAGQTWQLSTNYRSHPHLVEAVNRLFEMPKGKSDDALTPFYDHKLHYHVVSAEKKEADLCLHVGGCPQPPLQWAVLEEAGQPYRYQNRTHACDALAELLAADIVALLHPTDGCAGELLIDGNARLLCPSDLAVLVRDNDTARMVRDALRERRVPVVLIDRRSIFHTDTANHLYWLLVALWEEGDWRRIKRVLGGCHWFGLDARDLLTLEQDHERASDYLGSFAEAAETWRQDSVLAAVTRLFRRFHVWEKIARQRYGQRIVADLRHLLELLQEAAVRQHLTPYGLLAWYRRQLALSPDQDAQLRLESDDRAVEIVTMHSAKGLEYPLVFCFDLWRPESSIRGESVVCHTEEGAEVVFKADAERWERAKTRRQIEDRQELLRLAYVALTRAKAHCRVYLTEKNRKPAWSPLRHLVSRQSGHPDLFQAAAMLADRFPHHFGYRARNRSAIPAITLPRAGELEALQSPPSFQRRLKEEAQVVTSYSSLIRGQPHELPQSWLERLFEETEGEAGEPLPKGAAFGNLLHDILEKAPFPELLEGCIDLDFWQRQLRRNGLAADLAWDRVAPLIQKALTTPLPDFSLSQVAPAHQLKELEFFLPVGRLSASELNRRLAQSSLFRPLKFVQVHGFLHGFVDLVVEHDRRYYVIDYKSNELDDYQPDSLEKAMCAHDYGLQALFYTLAVHRYLGHRLPAYTYKKNFGGVRYLFLRGMDGRTPLKGVYAWQPNEGLVDWLEQTVGVDD